MDGVAVDEAALGKRLQLARKRAGLTQQELCQKAGLSYSTLAKIERGAIRSPSVFTVTSIANATGTPLENLLELTSPGSSSPALPDAKKRSKTGIRFIYFDVNGTLVRYYQRAFTEAARALGASADQVETVFWRHNDAACSGQLDLPEFNHAVAKELGVPAFDWHKYYMANVQAVPGMEEFVKWAAQHYEVGILSNSVSGFIDELKSKGLIPDVEYKVIVDSCQVGFAKPDPKIYEKAQELAAMEPKEILLIDDTRQFLTAADHTGWQVLWFNDEQPAESIVRAKQTLEF